MPCSQTATAISKSSFGIKHLNSTDNHDSVLYFYTTIVTVFTCCKSRNPRLAGPYVNQQELLKMPAAGAFLSPFLPKSIWKSLYASPSMPNHVRMERQPYTFRKNISSNRNKVMQECRIVWDAVTEATWATPVRYCERYYLKKFGQTLEQFAQRRCRSSILGNSQNSAGFNPAHNLTNWSWIQQGIRVNDLHSSLPI